jgi:hypothetical protein
MNGRAWTVAAALGVAAVSWSVAAQSASQGGTQDRPDLNGYWVGAPPGIAVPGPGGPPGERGGRPGGAGPEGGLFAGPPPSDPRDLSLAPPLRNGDISNLTNDGVLARRSGNNLPVYKPQFWDKVLDEDWNGNLRDPFNTCWPMGIPRMGAPTRIVQLANEVLFFYAVPFQKNEYRAIPIGPRRHPIDRDGTWLGDPVAQWDGNTLVVVTEGFNEQTWIGPEGYIHGYDLKVTEKFRLDGNALVYDVTVEDPEYLQQPWILATRRLARNPDPNFRMEEAPPCSERDAAHIEGKNREM